LRTAASVFALVMAYVGMAALAKQGTWTRLLASRPWLLTAFILAAAAIFLGLLLWIIALCAKLEMRPWQQGVIAAGAAVVFWAARRWGPGVAGDLALFFVAVFAGLLVARVVREANMLVPIAAVAAMVDIWGVYWGFVAHIMRKAPEVADTLSAQLPIAGKELAALPMISSVGAGDMLFAALFCGCVWKFGFPIRRTGTAILAAVLLGPVAVMVAASAAGHELKVLPGLPFIAAAVLAANWRRFHLSRGEKQATFWCLFICAGAIAIYTALRHFLRAGAG
jgi:hypothetical protein